MLPFSTSFNTKIYTERIFLTAFFNTSSTISKSQKAESVHLDATLPAEEMFHH